MVGNILGNRYEVLERIGTGGMSLVYRARDITLNRLVAVKILKHQWAEDDEVVRRFEQEARAAASLVDRHVVQVYDVGREEPDIYFMVMELVAGETLRAKLDRDAPLSVAEAMDIADQVAEALEVAHARKLVHRDIKPQNILITPQGEVKVTDFGIAYATTTGTLVNTGSLLGTVQYLSPEQARGKLIGPQSDLYSLGVVLFEMLSGQRPFESDSAIGVAIKHLQDEPPRIDVLRPQVSVAVADVVERALSKDPAERYQSAHAFRQDIARVLHPEPSLPEAAPLVAPPEESSGSKTRRANRGNKSAAGVRKKRLKWYWYLVFGAALVILAGSVVLVFNRWINTPLETVPNLRGQSLSRARLALAQRRLGVTLGGHASSTQVPNGRVLKETPAPGSQVKAGQSVVLVFSSGPAPIKVPELALEPVSLAKQSLQIVGLRAKVRRVASGYPQGEVVRQYPKAHASVGQGSTVTLWVSNGANQSQSLMPNLMGLTLVQAESRLAGTNVTLGTPSQQWSTQPSNTIIDQSPSPYSPLEGVSGVSLTVSSGTAPQSNTYPMEKSTVTWVIPSNVPPQSLLKIVVSDEARNEEVDYQQVNPNQPIEYHVVWYGTQANMFIFLNGQVYQHKKLFPAGSLSPSVSSSSISPSSPPSGSSSPLGGGTP